MTSSAKDNNHHHHNRISRFFHQVFHYHHHASTDKAGTDVPQTHDADEATSFPDEKVLKV